jgi:peroxiredoxin Q/BCP
MSGFWLLPILLAAVGLAWVLARRGAMVLPREGQPAPDFRLLDGEGVWRSLADFRGHWLVLYFYPRDHTPGCTREACALRDAWAGFAELGTVVLGVSLDNPARHADFSRRHRLPFPLLSDPGGQVALAYGALADWGVLRFARRYSFIIDPRGRVARVYTRVAPDRHAGELLADLESLAARSILPGSAG